MCACVCSSYGYDYGHGDYNDDDYSGDDYDDSDDDGDDDDDDDNDDYHDSWIVGLDTLRNSRRFQDTCTNGFC